MSMAIPIHYCPICGEDDEIDFIEQTATSAEWICDSCDEHIELYLADDEENEADEQATTPSILPFAIVILILFSYIYLTL